MAEESPFPQERELENEIDEELLLLLASAFLYATDVIVPSEFSRARFQELQDRFQRRASRGIPILNSAAQRAIEAGLERTRNAHNLDLEIDFNDERIQRYITRIFQDNIDEILDTNERMWARLQQIAVDRGWSEEELFERLKKYYGLTPNHLQTVLSMESALESDEVARAKIERQVQKRIDNLVEWRVRLFSSLVGTEIVEGSKDLSFTILGETGQLDRNEFVKQWVSTVDEDTTQTCLNSHLSVAEIGGYFPNNMKHPPNLNVIHPCRSSMRIIRRPS